MTKADVWQIARVLERVARLRPGESYAFWSISLYGADRYFAANPIGRHALGNRSQLERNAHGSLTLYVSRRRPPGPEENWLPSPGGAFYLILRVYHPQPGFLSGEYRMPKLERVA